MYTWIVMQMSEQLKPSLSLSQLPPVMPPYMRIWETTATGSLESMAKFFGGARCQ
jgi:hypothetical protein